MGQPTRLVVASTNLVKIGAVEQGFRAALPESDLLIDGVSLDSGVSDHPSTDAETLAGAGNRAYGAKAARLTRKSAVR